MRPAVQLYSSSTHEKYDIKKDLHQRLRHGLRKRHQVPDPEKHLQGLVPGAAQGRRARVDAAQLRGELQADAALGPGARRTRAHGRRGAHQPQRRAAPGAAPAPPGHRAHGGAAQVRHSRAPEAVFRRGAFSQTSEPVVKPHPHQSHPYGRAGDRSSGPDLALRFPGQRLGLVLQRRQAVAVAVPLTFPDVRVVPFGVALSSRDELGDPVAPAGQLQADSQRACGTTYPALPRQPPPQQPQQPHTFGGGRRGLAVQYFAHKRRRISDRPGADPAALAATLSPAITAALAASVATTLAEARPEAAAARGAGGGAALAGPREPPPRQREAAGTSSTCSRIQEASGLCYGALQCGCSAQENMFKVDIHFNVSTIIK